MVNKIVAGVDFSPASRRALERGSEWALRLNVPVLAVHVLPLPTPMPFGAGMEAPPALPEADWFESVEAEAANRLREWVSGLHDAQARVVWGTPSVKLLEQVDDKSLLVVAQKSHSKFEHLIFGSTASHVVREAPCDVLVVK